MLKKIVTSVAGLMIASSVVIPSGLALAAEPGGHMTNESASSASQEITLFKNNADTGYNFYFSGQGATQGTEGRQKDDSSSVYVRIDSLSGNGPRIYVDGSSSASGAWVDCTQGTHRADRYGEFNIWNGVFENSYRWARMTGWADLGWGSVSGVWSPDSWGEYPQL